jgi:hypothetical protein
MLFFFPGPFSVLALLAGGVLVAYVPLIKIYKNNLVLEKTKQR